jgi:hypothetical protein
MSHRRPPVAVVLVWCIVSMACGGPDTPSTVGDKALSASPSPERESRIETLLVAANPASTGRMLSAGGK